MIRLLLLIGYFSFSWMAYAGACKAINPRDENFCRTRNSRQLCSFYSDICSWQSSTGKAQPTLASLISTVPVVSSSASANWPTRGTLVTCGGMVDRQPLNMRVVVADEVLAADSGDGRALIYIDLHKPAQVRWLIADGMSDQEYEKREMILAKLSADDADQIRKLSASRQTDLYTGMTDGFITLRVQSPSGKSLDLSCQETRAPGGAVTE
jgi:hypothetical protein